MKEVEVYKRTDDDWFPSYETSDSKLVKVFYHQYTRKEDGVGVYVVQAWGDDDYGIGKHFDSEAKAWTVFLGIIGREVVSIEHLHDLGFRYDY